jgi:transcriptional regulator with PAS, ATPase and Fis domain
LPDYLIQGGGGRSQATAMPTVPAPPSDDLPLKDAKERWMQVLETSYLRGLLERHAGNVSAAAKAAGIARRSTG